MKSRLSLLLLLTCAFLVTPAAAQFPEPPPNSNYRNPLPPLDTESSRNSANRTPPTEARVLTKGVLAPAEADRLMYASFLSQSNTGLVHLLPRQFKNSKFARPDAVKINGGGAYYSFYYLSHEYGRGSDLELGTTLTFYGQTEIPPSHHFSVGFAGADFGILTNIGDVPIESVTRDDPSGEFMLKYIPPRLEQRARCEYRMLLRGVRYDGRMYASKAPIETNATYLLRSINYDTSDVLVAFRVVRQDPDDSVTIAWKLLKKFNRPMLDPRLKPDPTFQCPIR